MGIELRWKIALVSFSFLLAGCAENEAARDAVLPARGSEVGPAVAERNLESLGWTLPPLPAAVGTYVPAVRTESLLFVSGQLPMRDGNLVAKGRVGEAVSEDQAREAMRAAAMNALAVLRTELGTLDRVRRVVRVVGYVACTPEFGNQPQVTNAASEVFLQVFGRQRGAHSRLALGAASLPRNSPVELDVIVEVEP
jgi:enamine deaminase RidA (YjgF/YER057c/UK114 family)